MESHSINKLAMEAADIALRRLERGQFDWHLLK